MTFHIAIGPSCTDGDVRLWSAYNTPPNEGVAQICIDSTWYSFCYSDCYAAKLVCLQLGYPGAVGKWHIKCHHIFILCAY